MIDLSEFILKSNETKNDDGLYALLQQALAYECGYDRVIFSLMSDHTSLGLKAGHGIMRNYPDAWMKHYVEKGYEHIDPVRRFAFRHVGPFIWDQLPLVMDLTPRQELCLDQGREAGLHNGAATCLRGLLGEMAGIGVASSTDQGKLSAKDIKHRLSLLNALSQQFYVVFCSLHRTKDDLLVRQVELTQRELQILRHMASAKSNGVISDLLGISESTVNFHIRNILVKFGVSNRMTAVMRAIHSGIIGPDEAIFLRKS